jgi:hypothetical protein
MEPDIQAATGRLAGLIERPVRSVSFHRPLPQYIRGPLYVAGLVNAYAEELMRWYLSDSRGRWREGEVLPKLLASCDRPALQLLVHPIWWGDEHRAAADRLEDYFQAATRDMPADRAEALDVALAGHLSIRRRGRARPPDDPQGRNRQV